MTVQIEKSKAVGSVTAPPSKSMAHRALICGALTGGSVINNIADSEDIKATLGCLNALGADITVQGNTVKIGGLDPFSAKDGIELYCNESGSTLRFMLPLCMLSGNKITLRGSERLMQRPLSVYENIALKYGFSFEKTNGSVTVCGKFKSGDYTVPGDISSQFITGLLFVLPLLSGDSVIKVTGKFESASYIDLTLSAMKDFGITVSRKDNEFYILGGQSYKACEYSVEADCSNAAFLEGFNMLDGNVAVKGLKTDTLQGDRVYLDMFNGMKTGTESFDLSDCPDLGPVMFAVAAAMGGGFRFTGTARLKIKESDRAAAMAEELAKFGVKTDVFENEVVINECALSAPSVPLNSHNDHRIAMSLSLLCSMTGGAIDGAEAVNKSFPDFFKKIKSLGIGLVEKWD